MKNSLLSTLRNKETSCELFRQTAHQLGSIMASESDSFLSKKKSSIETPLAKTEVENIETSPTLVPILRSGTALLPSFLFFYPKAPIGFIGIRREEKTAKPLLYYTNLPIIHKESLIFLLDPMLATGQSASLAIDLLKEQGALEKNIVLFSILAANIGFQFIQQKHPSIRTSIVHIDPDLNSDKWIVPGLGDFGDRYFKT